MVSECRCMGGPFFLELQTLPRLQKWDGSVKFETFQDLYYLYYKNKVQLSKLIVFAVV